MNDQAIKQQSVLLPAIFSDHMIVQRNKPITLWGRSKTGQLIEVSLNCKDKKIACKQTNVDEYGKWNLTLPAQQAGGPFALSIKQADETIIINDVLIGDVWLASGQSNMEWKLGWQVNDWEQEVANSNYPDIRFFEIENQFAVTPQTHISASHWKVASPATSAEFSAVAWHFAKRYQQHTGIPIGIIDSTWGGTPAEAWTSLPALQHINGYQTAANHMLQNSQKWQVASELEATDTEVKCYNWQPGVLFNAMIHPLVAFPICGVIWYQGENNVAAHALYAELFKGLINDWRAHWQEPELPFLFVQLASYLKQQAQPVKSDWAMLREAQASALTLKNTAMAVTIDIGDADDIHPRNKTDVGERLWRAAQHLVLNENVPYSGPVFKHLEVKNLDGKNVVVVSYEHINGGLKCKGSELLGFAIAGADGKFMHAQANIEGDKVIVSSAKVKQPQSLRYAWADNSPANLYNAANLPAVPFRYTI